MKGSAIIVKRVDSNKKAETDEIEDLVRSAGYDIKSIFTQSRPEDDEYNIGQGKVHETQLYCQENNCETIIVDNELDPYQMYNYGIYVSDNVEILDRYSLILDIFENRAQSKIPKLQVELARLRYELPRAETKVRLSKRSEKPGFMGLGDYDESYEESVKSRIKNIKNELESIKKRKSKRRKQRREDGFDIVAISGYTNAGKSTLLRKLSEDHTVDENRSIPNDIKPTAESTEKYFTTIETTTRRIDMDVRDVLATDTVGFIANLPDRIIDAFSATFDSIYQADLVLLVVDVTEDLESIKRKIISSHDVISNRKQARVLTVLNKKDLVDDHKIKKIESEIEIFSPNPVAVSAEKGENISELKNRIHRALPPFQEDTLLLPLKKDTMPLVSWVYDNANVNNCEYTNQNVIIEYEGRKKVIEKAKSKASNLVSKKTHN